MSRYSLDGSSRVLDFSYTCPARDKFSKEAEECISIIENEMSNLRRLFFPAMDEAKRVCEDMRQAANEQISELDKENQALREEIRLLKKEYLTLEEKP